MWCSKKNVMVATMSSTGIASKILLKMKRSMVSNYFLFRSRDSRYTYL